MNYPKDNKIILFLIISLAIFLRTYHLGSIPPLNADEAAIGYNVYSLLQTGKDEHGHFWPIEFQSFNDYKPGGYFYLTLPSVFFLGLSEASVRLPNVILSVLSVYFIYLFAREVFNDSAFHQAPLLASFLLAISPWHIHFSRGAWEVNAATSFFLIGSTFLVKHKAKIHYLVLASIFYSLTMYTYHSMRLITPIFLAFVTFQLFKQTKKPLRYYVLPVSVFIILCLPLLAGLTNNNLTSRFGGGWYIF